MTVFTLVVLVILDYRYRVLPSSIQYYLPAHHAGLVITDITVTKCSKPSLISGCSLDANKWHRIEKDLYLNKAWLSNAYVHVQRKKEEELLPEDRIVVDVRVGRLDPVTSEKGEGDGKWESRPGGIWLKRSMKRHTSDAKKTITAVDVLFGADAVEPRPGWEVKDTPLLLSSSGGEIQEARLSVRRGPPVEIQKPEPRIRKDGKFKIMQVADLHLSTGIGTCRDPEPAGHNGGKCDADPRTLDFVGRLLDQEKPDLVVLSGDQINGDTAPDAQSVCACLCDSFFHTTMAYTQSKSGVIQIRRAIHQAKDPIRDHLRQSR